MTEDMRRGGGVASTSWMIWMAWGWRRKRWPGLCLSGSQWRTREAAEAEGWSMIAGIWRAKGAVRVYNCHARRVEQLSKAPPMRKKVSPGDPCDKQRDGIPAFGSRSDLRSSPLPFGAQLRNPKYSHSGESHVSDQGIHIPFSGPPFPCLVRCFPSNSIHVLCLSHPAG